MKNSLSKYLIILMGFVINVTPLLAADNVKNAANSVIDICGAPEFSYQQRIEIGANRFLKLLDEVKKHGDEGDTEFLVKAYESFSELFVSLDALNQRDAWNRKFLAQMNLKSSLLFNLYLFMAASYVDADEDVYKQVSDFKYQGDASLGLKFLAEIPISPKLLKNYDQARYAALLGTLQIFGGKLEESEKSFAQASLLVEKEFGKNSPEQLYFRMFEELPAAYSGDFKKALSIAQKNEENLKIFKRELKQLQKEIRGTDFVEYSWLLGRMASYSKRLGDSKAELKYNELALEAAYDSYGFASYILKPYQALCLPPNGPQIYLERSLFDIKERVANGYFLTGRIQKSKSMYKELIGDYKRAANKASGYSSFNINHVKSMMEPLTVIAPLCAFRFPEDEKIQSLAYDCSLQYKNFSLYADNLIQRMVHQDRSQSVKKLYSSIMNIKMEIVKNPESESGYREELKRLNNQLLVELDFASYGSLINVSWKEVQKSLKQESAAIEFMEIVVSEGKKVYLASVLKKQGSPKMVILGSDDEIASISDAYKSPETYRLIWEPLHPLLDGVKSIYFSATGRFYDMGIEYLPDSSGVIFNQKYDVFRLSSTRELATSPKRSINDNSVVYGGVYYGSKNNENRDETRSGLNYLPQTLEEAKNVAKTLSLSSSQNISLISADEATEESFKTLSGKTLGVLHIATHGFYWTERNAKRMKMPFLVKGKNRTAEDKAMSRSGLFLANANFVMTGQSVPKGKEDGVLTSSEIAQLDLLNVNLVVLSACQTGLGETNSEGVFGLQRGFKKAGAKTLVMSLWKVDDEATQILMSRFYQSVAEGKTLHDAFVLAQDFLRRTQEGRFNDPYYWAAFVMLDAV